MAISNYERVGKALELLRDGLKPFVARELEGRYGKAWITTITQSWQNDLTWKKGSGEPNLDAAVLLHMLWDQWNAVFKEILGPAERSLVSELRDARNKWAHQDAFSGDDCYRVLDSAARLLTAISAPQSTEIEKMKNELLRVRFDEQVRTEKRRAAGTVIESQTAAALKPWRDIVTPHADVASGRYMQAEFAADLWQVHMGEGSDEYKNPEEFFRRTYLTESLKGLLVNAARRLSGAQGDPVVQLQTNFGGGKTHSMLALYHLFSGNPTTKLLGIDEVLKIAGVATLPAVRRVVLVGNKISPGNPVTKADGTVVRTLWGELAWQLGGKKASNRIKADDEKATSPGDALRELFNEYGPCMVLIDEWVAYARQLHDNSDLPAGSFETHFSFAQVLTESAKLARQCLLVVSLPASDTSGSPHAIANDAEVGGERGRAALERLRNAVGRVEASWRPASTEEGFEIVRRRLFQPLTGPQAFTDRDLVARAFADLYRAQQSEFPPECHESDYEKRIQAAYPIHPEVFDRLYSDWSTLVKFQRTRGVLRLMASVIHTLWEKDDRNPLIMPANIAIDEPRVAFELTRYLSDNWPPVIEKDVDGPEALPRRIDQDVANLGRHSAARRVARTIYLGSAPTEGAANRGLEDRRIKLGCVMPDETPAVFGDALRRLASAATYLYQDGARYWYSVQPTVTKLAEDRAGQLKRKPDDVAHELARRLQSDLRKTGDFGRIHTLPQGGQDVLDDTDARLVVLAPETPYSKESGSLAEKAAAEILRMRGNSPRLFQNTLVFLAADRARMQDLDDALRRYLAWESIVEERVTLNLTPQQVKQAETQKTSADATVAARLPETYQWLLAPRQDSPTEPVTWQTLKLSGNEALAVRASKKLRNDEGLLTGMAGSRLKMDLDSVPLWRGEHVTVSQLKEDFARYPFLPRLQSGAVLAEAVRAGATSMTWQRDGFAYADSYDASAQRYRGLKAGLPLALSEIHDAGVILKSEVALRQIEAERLTPAPAPPGEHSGKGKAKGAETCNGQQPDRPPKQKQYRRFHASVVLNTTRVVRDVGDIAEEVLDHLSALSGATVTVTLDIEAELPNGVTDALFRTVMENSRALKFDGPRFEEE